MLESAERPIRLYRRRAKATIVTRLNPAWAKIEGPSRLVWVAITPRMTPGRPRPGAGEARSGPGRTGRPIPGRPTCRRTGAGATAAPDPGRTAPRRSVPL